MAGAVDLYIVYQFVRRLSTPFDQTDAFKLGLIDKDGKRLKYAKTPEEKEAMTYFDRLIFNLKRILHKFGLTSKVSNFAAALFLMKEQHNIDLPIYVDNEDWILEGIIEQQQLVESGQIYEDAPTNSVGGGHIAGTDNNPPGRSKLLNKKMLRRRKILRFQDMQIGRSVR